MPKEEKDKRRFLEDGSSAFEALPTIG